MLPAKIYSIAVPAGGMVELAVQGDFFKVLSATATLRVNGDSFGTIGDLLAGQGLEDTPFTRLQFTNTSGAINNVRVLIAGDKFVDDRITGEVSVIDGGKVRTLAGQAFMGYGYIAGLAANYSLIQLYNASVNKNLFVSQILATSTAPAAGGIVVRAGIASVAFLSNATNKDMSGASSSAGTVRAANGPALSGTGLCTVSKGQLMVFKEPILLRPGATLSTLNATLAEDLLCTFEFTEEELA